MTDYDNADFYDCSDPETRIGPVSRLSCEGCEYLCGGFYLPEQGTEYACTHGEEGNHRPVIDPTTTPDWCPVRSTARPMPDVTRASVIAFARETWDNDGAEGETVHLLCDELELAHAKLAERARADEQDDLSAAHWRSRYESAAHDHAAVVAELERLRSTLGFDRPWPLLSVLQTLADAAEHLLGYHSCDTHGHEVIGAAMRSAREIVAAVTGDSEGMQGDTAANEHYDLATATEYKTVVAELEEARESLATRKRDLDRIALALGVGDRQTYDADGLVRKIEGMARVKVCSTCNGTGSVTASGSEAVWGHCKVGCSQCNGKGKT